MFSFAMTRVLANDCDEFRNNAAQGAKIWRYGTLQKFRFFVQPTTFLQFQPKSSVLQNDVMR